MVIVMTENPVIAQILPVVLVQTIRRNAKIQATLAKSVHVKVVHGYKQRTALPSHVKVLIVVIAKTTIKVVRPEQITLA